MSPVFLWNGLLPTKTNEALFYKTNIFILCFYVQIVFIFAFKWGLILLTGRMYMTHPAFFCFLQAKRIKVAILQRW